MSGLQSLTNSVEKGMVLSSFDNGKRTPVIDTRDQKVTLLNLNFDQVYGLHNSGFSCQQTSVQDTPCCWNDLTTPTMNGISVEGHIIDVESTVAHVLICQTALRDTRVTRILHKPGFQQGRQAPSAWVRLSAWRRRALSWRWG